MYQTAKITFISSLVLIFIFSAGTFAQQAIPHRPYIDSEFWRIVNAPNLDSLNGENPQKQHVIDHGFVKDDQNTWHLWACMRGTKLGRLFYGWKGNSLSGPTLEPAGIVARAASAWGEQVEPEKIQAPYFLKEDGMYYCFYNSNGIRVMTSENGADYKRAKIKNNSNLLYEQGGRDVMVMVEDDTYYAYSTVSTVAKDGWLRGFIIVRTSDDLVNWSDYTIVSEGGRAGNGAVSAESPFVQKYKGYYYLFRSSSSTGTCFVYRSTNPYNFGVNNDDKLIAELPVWAPEVIFENNQWYISDIADFQGIKLARLNWMEDL